MTTNIVYQEQLKQLFGKSTEHLAEFNNSSILVHKSIIAPLTQLNQNAQQTGISLQVASGFRSFERQLTIWNEKVTGTRPLLDDKGRSIDIRQLSNTEKLWAILRWSALPGTSRHHWGTDIDIWDSAAVADDYQLQLIPEEYGSDGPFSLLGQWLSSKALEKNSFYRPYCSDKGGTAAEPWHLSFKPIAEQYENLLEINLLQALIKETDILLKKTIEENLEEIFTKYVLC